MSAYDHPPEYPPEDEGEGAEVEDRRTARRDIDWWRRQRDAEAALARDLERDTIDRVNEWGGP